MFVAIDVPLTIAPERPAADRRSQAAEPESQAADVAHRRDDAPGGDGTRPYAVAGHSPGDVGQGEQSWVVLADPEMLVLGGII